MTKNTNQYGFFMRRLRRENNETIIDAGARLGVSIAFLSSTENGRKLIPLGYAEIIRDAYNLSDEEYDELQRAIDLSNKRVIVKFDSYDEKRQNLCIDFKRNIGKLSDEDIDKISKIINK